MENLPGASDMLSLTLPNADLLYYPFNYKENKPLDVFDFTYQKKVGETEEFVSVDKGSAQNKQKKNQKYQKHNQKRGNQANKTYIPVSLQRFNINQSIQPDLTWILIKELNKVQLEKLVILKKF